MIEAYRLLSQDKEITILHLDRLYSEQFINKIYHLGAKNIFIFKESKEVVIIADYSNHKSILLESIKITASIAEVSKNVFRLCHID
jgi:hypothetical protein